MSNSDLDLGGRFAKFSMPYSQTRIALKTTQQENG